MKNALSRKPAILTRSIAALLAISAFAPQSARAAIVYWDNNGTNPGFGSAGGTWATPTVSQWSTIITDGTGTPSASLTTTGADTLNFGNGATGLGSGTITVTGSQNAASLIFATGSGNIALSGGSIGSLSNITVNGSATATISSNINGTNINKNGTGTLTLSGTQTYAAIFRLQEGTLILDETGTFGTSAATLNFFANNTMALQTTASTTKILANRTFVGATTSMVSGGQSIEFSGNVTMRGNNNLVLTNNITGVGKALIMSGNVGLFNGAGTNTFFLAGSGTTNITGVVVDNVSDGGVVSAPGGGNKLTNNITGTLTLSGANTYGGATTLQGGGTTVLDYGTSNTSKLSDTAALNLGGGTFSGGTLTLKGATGSHEEIVLSTSLNAGGTFLTRDVNGGANTLKLRMNTITRAAGGTISFGDATIANTDTNNFGASGVNAILGGWATLGNDWAVSADTGAADTTITALASYTTFVNNVGSSTANYLLNGGDTLGGPTAVGTLKITNSSNSQTLNLDNNNLTVTSTSATALGGIMYAGGNDNLYTIGNGGGTGRIVSSAANQELIFAVQTGTLSVSAFVGLSSASSPVTKSGGGAMEISSNNDFTGAVRVNQGVLRLAHANATGTTAGGIVVQNGAALELANGVAVGDEALNITGTGISSGGALRNVASSTASYVGAITIGLSGARINSDSSGALTLSGGIVTAFDRHVTIGGAGNTTVQTVGISGAGNLIKADAGTATLSATNTYTGTTTVTGGTLLVSGSISGSASTVSNAGSTLGGTGTVAAVTVNSGAILQGGDGLSASDDLSSGGNVSLNNGSIIKLTLGAANAHSSLTRTAGTWAFDNDQSFTFIGTQAGTFDNIIAGLAGTETNLITGGSTAWNFSDVNWNYAFAYDNAGGVDLTIIAVPEPGAAMSLLGGLGLLLGVRRRRSA